MKLKFSVALSMFMLYLGWQANAQIYDTNDDVVEVFAGSGNSGLLNAQGTLAVFSNPKFVAADTSSNLYVCDFGNNLIREITPNGSVSSFASVNMSGGVGGMAIDGNGTIWVTVNGGIEEITSSGSVNFLSYTGVNSASGICTDRGNNIYYTAGNQVFRISADGVLTVLAGNTSESSTDGNGIYASFAEPGALAVDEAGNIYVYDGGSDKIRRIDSGLNVTTIAGGNSGNLDGVGLNTGFLFVSAMCSDNQGNIIMACGDCVRKMTATTNVVTLAGSFTQSSYANGAGSLARFSNADGVCLSGGMIFVADLGNQRIRQISFNPQPQLVTPANLALNTYAGITISGLVGRTYQIQSSSDLTNWTTRATVLLTSSPYLWFDLNPVTGNKFYQAVLLP
jgi:sugar lactone lactonase YvrE